MKEAKKFCGDATEATMGLKSPKCYTLPKIHKTTLSMRLWRLQSKCTDTSFHKKIGYTQSHFINKNYPAKLVNSFLYSRLTATLNDRHDSNNNNVERCFTKIN